MNRPSCLQHREITPPQVFISSTFEDLLKEIRDLLRSELEEINFLPVMSELGTFNYTHGRMPVYDDTIEAVASSQIYVLVIGRKYGTVHPTQGKSITELEYAAARAANLPILVYVQSRVWDGYEARQKGAIARGKHTHWVDDIRVFDFIEQVATQDACRCVSFEHADEILTDFHRQMANLFGGYLRFEGRAAKWLWNEWRTRTVESAAELVWVVTPNFYWDYSDVEFRSIVYNNITARGTTYYYLFRDTPDNEARIAEMARDYAADLGDVYVDQFQYAAVPVEEFNWCTEQVLYNPYSAKNEHGIIVDIMDARDKNFKYNVELGPEKLLAFREQFERLWKLYGSGDPRSGAGRGTT